MELHLILLAVTGFTAGMAAGVFFTFTALVIPGLLDMNHRESLRGFQAIDGRLQPGAPSVNWQPLFGLFLFGTSALTVVALLSSWPHVTQTVRTLVATAAILYNLGCWLPTLLTIVPFNNRVRDTDLDALSPTELAQLRSDFERNWRGWNLVRTASSAGTFALLIAAIVASS